jgi:uncharacterized protein (TIGR02594 family)
VSVVLAVPPPWLTIARSYIGVHEIPGPTSHPTILQWGRNMGGWVAQFFRDDATPWCALFVNAVLQQAGLPMSGPEGSPVLVRAKSFTTYGRALTTPCRGAIAVFERAGGGHVGFIEGETLKAYRICGGNQSDSVSSTWIAKDRCIAVRWPLCDIPPGDHYWLRPDSSPFSTNES